MKVIVSTNMKSESATRPKNPAMLKSLEIKKTGLTKLQDELAKVDAQLGKPAILKKHDLLKAKIDKVRHQMKLIRSRYG